MKLPLYGLMLAALLAAPAAQAGGRKPKPLYNESSPDATATPVPVETAAEPPAEEPAAEPPRQEKGDAQPVYLAEVSNPNDFVLFANGGGWDGNWFVGYNTCWVSKLPAAPAGEYKRAFIGAKLGRMKTESIPGRPSWEKRPIPGEVNIAVAQEPLWPQSRRFVLTETGAIPLEGDAENAVEGVGESNWFWVEVPVRFVSTERENYVALYSPTPALSKAARAPVLAAAPGDTRQNTWLNSTVKGEPPFNREDALKTPVTYFEPAIAIKLVPVNREEVEVRLRRRPPEDDHLLEDKVELSADVHGKGIQSVWVEYSTDTRVWRPAGLPLSGAPYIFTVKRGQLLEGANRVRVAATDVLENKGVSETLTFHVPPAAPAKKR